MTSSPQPAGSNAAASPPPSPPVPLTLHEPQIPSPERNGGEIVYSRVFLTHCKVQFEFVVSALLTSRPMPWGIAEWSSKSEWTSPFQKFGEELTHVFDSADPESVATHALLNLFRMIIASESINLTEVILYIPSVLCFHQRAFLLHVDHLYCLGHRQPQDLIHLSPCSLDIPASS